MFEQLQNKWKVSGLKLTIIIVTFAIGGSLTGYTGKKIMNLLPVERGIVWLIMYLILIVIIWPLAVLLVSIPLGQFSFFKSYIRRMGLRLGFNKREAGIQHPETGQVPKETVSPLPHDGSRLPTSMAIFASGAGSNAQRIISHFRNHPLIRVSLIVCNKPGAGVLSIAQKENIPALLIDKEKFFRGDAYVPELKEKGISFIVLAGFLWRIPALLIQGFSNRIVNIHPALLPKYGGKGMYGHFVHEAVIAAGDKESGITIHYVDELYDHGKIIFQEKCTLVPGETPDTLAGKIHELEHRHFPVVIEKLLTN
jgi:formyltetrahydrofolate-dependent phosphoribosylglycinamide formyltransferase